MNKNGCIISYPVLKQPPNKRKLRTTNNIPLALIKKKNAEAKQCRCFIRIHRKIILSTSSLVIGLVRVRRSLEERAGKYPKHMHLRPKENPLSTTVYSSL